MKRRVALVFGIASMLVLAVAAVALAATFKGTNGPNTISGGTGNDQIYGLAGADTLSGAAGNDYIECGAGIDTCEGNADNDNVWGGPGGTADDPELLFGNSGNDLVNGGPGFDDLNGGDGADLLDSVDGVSGNDTIVDDGNDANDVCVIDFVPNVSEDATSGCNRTYRVDTTGAGPANP